MATMNDTHTPRLPGIRTLRGAVVLGSSDDDTLSWLLVDDIFVCWYFESEIDD
ncbi:hypothetical protein HALLA_03040 (plasmid) [Halostagnicola larsenii XH-48]|uniref:Uncharacterized protein n=1 Tax=Halostagnicola larsenii XH-48 TaxID=797299 RepID=W0JRN7_9EURY|nr:hypothetical protein HALLA_03040 [Halostagnicola larsenii XH-48]